MNNQNQSHNVDSTEKLAKESGANSPRETREAMPGAKSSPTEMQYAGKGSSAQSAQEASSDKDEKDEIDHQVTKKSDLRYRKAQEDSSAHH
jgi:hypothetical protein